jgi:hypothetical protein
MAHLEDHPKALWLNHQNSNDSGICIGNMSFANGDFTLKTGD